MCQKYVKIIMYTSFNGLGNMNFKRTKKAFTLAEVMLTLSLVGVLASLTVPTIGASLQKRARLSEFRAAYALLEAALKNTTNEKGSLYACYLMNESEKNEYGYIYGSRSSADISACSPFETAFMRTLGYTRRCAGEDLNEEGCLPSRYAELGTTFNSERAYVLNNSMLLIPSRTNSMATFAVDVNGRKGPNRWGQDIFPFSFVLSRSEYLSSLRKSVPKTVDVMPPPPGEIDASIVFTSSARTTKQMINEASGR